MPASGTDAWMVGKSVTPGTNAGCASVPWKVGYTSHVGRGVALRPGPCALVNRCSGHARTTGRRRHEDGKSRHPLAKAMRLHVIEGSLERFGIDHHSHLLAFLFDETPQRCFVEDDGEPLLFGAAV